MKKQLAFLAFLFLTAPTSSDGKAAFADKQTMVDRSDVIAVVDIKAVDKIKTEGAHWTYSEKATARIDQTLKGEVPKTVDMYGGENFICAQVHYVPGKALVFLKRDKDKLAGCNWHLSVRPIKDGKLEWYADAGPFKLKEQPLKDVIAEVKSLIATSK